MKSRALILQRKVKLLKARVSFTSPLTLSAKLGNVTPGSHNSIYSHCKGFSPCLPFVSVAGEHAERERASSYGHGGQEDAGSGDERVRGCRFIQMVMLQEPVQAPRPKPEPVISASFPDPLFSGATCHTAMYSARCSFVVIIINNMWIIGVTGYRARLLCIAAPNPLRCCYAAGSSLRALPT